MEIKELIGKTLTKCTGSVGDDEMVFETTDGKGYRLYHSQDCCESVLVEDICGELADLVGSPIIQAEENSSKDDPPNFKRECEDDSFTWTFYRLATAKGQVVIRWYGSSNGYYSESVDFEEIKASVSSPHPTTQRGWLLMLQQQPTEEGKRRFPPNGVYDDCWPCTCKPECGTVCKGEYGATGCKCKACGAAYCDATEYD